MLDLDEAANERFDFYDVTVEARGFLYQQVRRLTGVLVAGGTGTVASLSIITFNSSPGAVP